MSVKCIMVKHSKAKPKKLISTKRNTCAPKKKKRITLKKKHTRNGKKRRRRNRRTQKKGGSTNVKNLIKKYNSLSGTTETPRQDLNFNNPFYEKFNKVTTPEQEQPLQEEKGHT